MASFTAYAIPSFRKQVFLYFLHAFHIFLGSLFLGWLARISLPLWFTPVPLTLQTLGVLLIGGFLGSRKGALAILLYLVEGALGLPFFATSIGVAALFGPAGGYLVGFLAAAYLMGLFLENRTYSFQRAFIASLFTSLLILFCGSVHLSLFVGLKKAWFLGFFPFLIGDFLKSFIAASLLSLREPKE